MHSADESKNRAFSAISALLSSASHVYGCVYGSYRDFTGFLNRQSNVQTNELQFMELHCWGKFIRLISQVSKVLSKE